MDQHVLQRIVSGVSETRTLASLACCSKQLCNLVAEELSNRACCKDFQHVLGVAPAPTDAPRAAALLAGTFRRQFLSDLAAAQSEGKLYDGRRQQWDLLTLPQGGKWLAQTDLLISDQQHVLLYSGSFKLLGALSFVDRPSSVVPAAQQQPRARVFWGLISSLLFKCGLRCGLYFLEPPLLLGAADYVLSAQLLPCQREELNTLAAGASWQRQLGMDDDVHLIRLSLLRLRLLCQITLLGGRIGGCLDNGLLQQMFRHQAVEPLKLHFLDVSSTNLTDASLAQLLGLCPELRVLRAANSDAGAGVLAALAGLQFLEQAEVDPEANARHHRQAQQTCCGTDTPGRTRLGLALAATQHLAAPDSANSGGLCPCPMLQELDLSGCHGVKGSGLRRALCCLTHLAVLRLNDCGGLHAVISTLGTPASDDEEHCTSYKSSHGGGSTREGKHGGSSCIGGRKKQGGSSGKEGASSGHEGSKAGALAAMLGGLTTLEVLGADDLSTPHVASLLRHCTSLRCLALSGKLLAAERLDRQPLRRVLGSTSQSSNDGDSTSSTSSALPSLLHLTVGYGTGGLFGQQLAAASPNLLSLTCGLGAEVSDWHLEQVAGSCTALARLSLKGGNVTDQGVAAVLQHCPQLTSLHLLSCTGPFTGNLASQPVSASRATSAADAAQAEAEWSRPPAFRLQDLIIKYGASALTDGGLAALLHPDMAALRCLVLAGCSQLSDAAWDTVAQHAGTLECLQLDSCGALPTVQKGRARPGAAAALSAGAAVKALSTCRRLQALTIRNCVSPAVSQAQRDGLCTACTVLQTLELT